VIHIISATPRPALVRTYRPARQAQIPALGLLYAAMHDVQPNVDINVCSSKLYILQHEARRAQLLMIPPSTACDRCFAVKRCDATHSRCARCDAINHYGIERTSFCTQRVQYDVLTVLHGVHETTYGVMLTLSKFVQIVLLTLLTSLVVFQKVSCTTLELNEATNRTVR